MIVYGKQFTTIIVLACLSIMTLFAPLHANELSVLQAEQTANELLKLSNEFKALSLRKLPKGLSPVQQNASDRHLARLRKLGNDYKSEAARLRKDASDAKCKKIGRVKFIFSSRLIRDTELLSTDISQSVNEMNRMNEMFAKILQRLHEGQMTIIRNM